MPSFAIKRPDSAFSQTAPKLTKKQRQRDEQHLKFIRELPCVVTGTRPVEAAHIRYGDMARYGKYETGAGERPHDKFAVPLSPLEHRRQHGMNERDYWVLAGIDPLHVASLLWLHTGDNDTCEQILAATRATAKPSALTKDTHL